MNILGISCHYHDAAAALLVDGRLVAAAQEERFSRQKHDSTFPTQAIEFCLAQAKLRAGDLDHVVFYEKPFVKAERLFTTILATFPRSRRLFRDGMHLWISEKLWIKDLIRRHVAIGRGRGDWNGGDNRLELTHDLGFPHSLGLLYSVFTAFLGFEVNEGEYKVMGMAPFGVPKYVDRVKQVVELREDGSLWLDPAYVSFSYHTERSFTRKFETLFGPPRDPRARFVTPQTSLYDDPNPPTASELRQNQYYADVAASIQAVTEEVMIAMARHVHRQTGLAKLCIAGGVGLNCVANYKVLQATPFDEIYVQPAAGDAGGALGAALYAHHVLLGQPRRFVMDHAYWGKTYPDSLIVDTLRSEGVAFETVEDDERCLDQVVDAMQSGQVVGWYHGAFEWGPRALGSRSIIADPRRADMKDVVNIKIKFREPFRPFAPSVLAEKSQQFFDLPDAAKHYPTRFMLYVAPVIGDRVPAITHVDGSSRPQLVHRDVSPRYYRLIEKFGEATDVPLVMNTSFNLRGEPIVSAPIDALDTFRKSGIDLLVLEDHLVRKPR
jgi:carbamoyltransferase